MKQRRIINLTIEIKAADMVYVIDNESNFRRRIVQINFSEIFIKCLLSSC